MTDCIPSSTTQVSFTRDSQAGDNLLILRHVIENSFSNRKKVYPGFVDFKRAFDTIPRDLMLYKLHLAGLPLQIIRVIQSMYHQTVSAVKLSNGTT